MNYFSIVFHFFRVRFNIILGSAFAASICWLYQDLNTAIAIFLFFLFLIFTDSFITVYSQDRLKRMLLLIKICSQLYRDRNKLDSNSIKLVKHSFDLYNNLIEIFWDKESWKNKQTYSYSLNESSCDFYMSMIEHNLYNPNILIYCDLNNNDRDSVKKYYEKSEVRYNTKLNLEYIYDQQLEKKAARLSRSNGKSEEDNFTDLLEAERDIVWQKTKKEIEEDSRDIKTQIDNAVNATIQVLTGCCPYCHTKIPKTAIKCPHCTADLYNYINKK